MYQKCDKCGRKAEQLRRCCHPKGQTNLKKVWMLECPHCGFRKPDATTEAAELPNNLSIKRNASHCMDKTAMNGIALAEGKDIEDINSHDLF